MAAFVGCFALTVVRPVSAASYLGLEVKSMEGGVKAGGVAAAGTSWEATKQAAWEALGDVSSCMMDPRLAGKPAWELRFQAQLERAALSMDDAEAFYKCAIVADPLYAQSWIEMADIHVHAADDTNLHWRRALALFEYAKLLQPRDAQAWHGAGSCANQLRLRQRAAKNYGHLQRGDFPVTAREWYILAEVAELSSFASRDATLRYYKRATSLHPSNSIYSPRLWHKLGQHGFRGDWSGFHRSMAARGANHADLLGRMQRPLQRTPRLGDAPDRVDSAPGTAAEQRHPGALAQAARNDTFARLAEIDERYSVMRKAIFAALDDATCDIVGKTDTTSLLLRFLPMKRDSTREQHVTGQEYKREFADVFSAEGIGLDRTPYGMRWDDRNFPLHLAALLQAACNVTCTAEIPAIVNNAWQLDTASVKAAVANLVRQERLRAATSTGSGGGDTGSSNMPATTAGPSVGAAPYASVAVGGGGRSATAASAVGDEKVLGAVNAPDSFGMTAAHMAIFRGDVLTFRALLADPTLDLQAKDMFGNSPLSLLQRWHLQPEHEAMHGLAMEFLRAADPEAHREVAQVSNLFPPGAKVQRAPANFPAEEASGVVPASDAPSAVDWLERTRTVPWGPLATWDPARTIEELDPTMASLGDLIRDYIAAGRPVLVKNILRACPEASALWERGKLLSSELGQLNASAFRVPYGEDGEANLAAPTMTMAEFAARYMGRTNLTDASDPRYVFQHHQHVHPVHNERIGQFAMDPITEVLNCLPQELQDYLHLPPAGMPGAWTHWTVGMGGSGSGAPFHMHDAAVNVVIKGTKRWFVYPPTYSTYSTEPIFEFLRDVYPTLPPHLKPIEFLQEAGDLVVLPAWWAHATVSVGDCLCISKVVDNNSGHPDQHNSWGPLRAIRFDASDHATVLERFNDVPLV